MVTSKSKDTIAELLMILLLGGIGLLVSVFSIPGISPVPILLIGLATVVPAIGLAWLHWRPWVAVPPEHTGVKGRIWLVLRGVGGLILVLGALGVLVADILSGFGWAPSRIEGGLLLIAGNVAFLVGCWYAFFRPRTGPAKSGR